MRSRAAILPYPGDPFLLNYWFSLYDRFWKTEVDRLYVVLNSPVEKSVVDYIKKLCDSRTLITFIYVDQQIEHGKAIEKALIECNEDYVMLIEDDGFIFKSGLVDFAFSQIEGGNFQVVGSKRGSCAMEILERAKDIWGLEYEGEGDHGCNFWPNFFFCKKELLLNTDRQFGARAWMQGEEIQALSHNGQPYHVKGEIANGDTFVNTSLQIRAMVPKEEILCLPQYHGHPDDLKNYEDKYEYSMFNGRAGWCHIGSLSSGVGGLLKDDENRSLSRRMIDPPGGPTKLPLEWCTSEMEHREFERRVQWWLTFWEYAQNAQEIPEFYDLYGRAVYRIIDQYGLSIKAIRRRQEIYKTLGL